MNKTQKEQQVAELRERLSGVPAVFLADYRGINVDQATTLRAKLRAVGVDYRVVKNTLLSLAAKDTDTAALDPFLAGPTAAAFSGEDVAAAAKVLTEFAKAVEKFELKGGVMGGKVLSVDDIKALSSLPSREELLAKMLGSLNAPASNFVGLMAAIPRSLVNVLTAIKDQKAA